MRYRANSAGRVTTTVAAVCTLIATIACTDSAAPLALGRPSRERYRGAITTTAARPATVPADSAAFTVRLVGVDDDGQWDATLVTGRVDMIRELQGGNGFRRLRVYAFDSAGALRGYSERAYRSSETGPLDLARVPDRRLLAIDSAQTLGPDDYLRTAVLFLADQPVLYARASKSGPLPVARIEFRNLVARAHTLYSAALSRRFTTSP